MSLPQRPRILSKYVQPKSPRKSRTDRFRKQCDRISPIRAYGVAVLDGEAAMAVIPRNAFDNDTDFCTNTHKITNFNRIVRLVCHAIIISKVRVVVKVFLYKYAYSNKQNNIGGC